MNSLVLFLREGSAAASPRSPLCPQVFSGCYSPGNERQCLCLQTVLCQDDSDILRYTLKCFHSVCLVFIELSLVMYNYCRAGPRASLLLLKTHQENEIENTAFTCDVKSVIVERFGGALVLGTVLSLIFCFSRTVWGIAISDTLSVSEMSQTRLHPQALGCELWHCWRLYVGLRAGLHPLLQGWSGEKEHIQALIWKHACEHNWLHRLSHKLHLQSRAQGLVPQKAPSHGLSTQEYSRRPARIPVQSEQTAYQQMASKDARPWVGLCPSGLWRWLELSGATAAVRSQNCPPLLP